MHKISELLMAHKGLLGSEVGVPGPREQAAVGIYKGRLKCTFLKRDVALWKSTCLA